MKTNQKKERKAPQSHHQRKRNNRKRNIVRIPRDVWNVFATQTAIILQQALLLEKVVCSQSKQDQ